MSRRPWEVIGPKDYEKELNRRCPGLSKSFTIPEDPVDEPDLVIVRKDDLNEALLRLLSAYTSGGQHKEYDDEEWFKRLEDTLKG